MGLIIATALVEITSYFVVWVCSFVYGCRRVCSMFSVWRYFQYFSFYLWLFLLVLVKTEEETRTQQAFAALMAISYVVVIVESRSSLELQYLKNLLVSFLERQRLERPKIFVGVESYHYANISSSNVTYTEKEI